MSSATAPAQLQGTALPMNQKLFAFATMCLGMFIALLDIQIVAVSLRDIGGGLFAGDGVTVWVQTSFLLTGINFTPLSGWLFTVISIRWIFGASPAGFTLLRRLGVWAWDL